MGNPGTGLEAGTSEETVIDIREIAAGYLHLKTPTP